MANCAAQRAGAMDICSSLRMAGRSTSRSALVGRPGPSTRPGIAPRHRVNAGFAPQPQRAHRPSVAPRVKPGETPEQALERRKRESARVAERVTYIYDLEDWQRELQQVGLPGGLPLGAVLPADAFTAPHVVHSALIIPAACLSTSVPVLLQAGDKLVVLNIESPTVCQTGFDEEPELHWKADQAAAMEPCRAIQHTFARTARECADVVFLSLEVCGCMGQRGLEHTCRVGGDKLQGMHAEPDGAAG